MLSTIILLQQDYDAKKNPNIDPTFNSKLTIKLIADSGQQVDQIDINEKYIFDSIKSADGTD